jgi:L-ribulose-5-phosphate 4-epimerase
VPYETMRASDLVITTLEGKVVEGTMKPSSDLATHIELYRAFPHIGGVVHTHSRMATAWAQAGREIPCLGTTHADYFHGPVPLTAQLTSQEIEEGYEQATGLSIVRRFEGLDPLSIPGVLVLGHAAFCWGKDPEEAARHAVILEEVAALAYYSTTLNPMGSHLAQAVLDKHHLRKHGPKAYYGQH